MICTGHALLMQTYFNETEGIRFKKHFSYCCQVSSMATMSSRQSMASASINPPFHPSLAGFLHSLSNLDRRRHPQSPSDFHILGAEPDGRSPGLHPLNQHKDDPKWDIAIPLSIPTTTTAGYKGTRSTRRTPTTCRGSCGQRRPRGTWWRRPQRVERAQAANLDAAKTTAIAPQSLQRTCGVLESVRFAAPTTTTTTAELLAIGQTKSWELSTMFSRARPFLTWKGWNRTDCSSSAAVRGSVDPIQFGMAERWYVGI